ncbi:MAG: hypothetical protein M3550_11170 [Actinomycetota bacterium]|nr:hypothetical protein [Actinomycetota bacterium]
MTRPDEVPRLARPFVALLVAAMVASAVFLFEPWPLTSFRLFSHLRTDAQRGWNAAAVSDGGAEQAYPIANADGGYRNFGFQVADFESADDAQRDAVCRAWVAAGPQVVGHEVDEVRLYRRSWLLSERIGERALAGERELLYRCDAQGLDG